MSNWNITSHAFLSGHDNILKRCIGILCHNTPSDWSFASNTPSAEIAFFSKYSNLYGYLAVSSYLKDPDDDIVYNNVVTVHVIGDKHHTGNLIKFSMSRACKIERLLSTESINVENASYMAATGYFCPNAVIDLDDGLVMVRFGDWYSQNRDIFTLIPHNHDWGSIYFNTHLLTEYGVVEKKRFIFKITPTKLNVVNYIPTNAISKRRLMLSNKYKTSV